MRLALAVLCHLLPQQPPPPQPIVIDVAGTFGNISFQSIRAAMERAQQVVNISGASAVVFLRAGSHTVDMAGGNLFDISGAVPAAGQRLIVAGAGMYDTTLVTRTHNNDVIHAHPGHGRSHDPMWRRVSFENMTFAREGQTTTQGRLLAADEHGIELEISEGFPQLDEVMVNMPAKPSLWFRRYVVAANASGEPRLVTDRYNNAYWKPRINQQVSFACCNTSNATCQHSASAWVCPAVERLPGSNRKWRLSVKKWPTNETQRYQEALRDPSQRIAIKVKHGGQAYHLQQGDDVAFLNVRWLGHSRGAVIDTSNVLFRNTRVDRLPPPAVGSEVPLLASNAGGPQILGNSQPVFNLTVVNHTSTATGDDSLALFNVRTGLIAGCHIKDAFGRGIVMCSSSAVQVSGNELARNPLFWVNASSYAQCLCTDGHISPKGVPQCVYPKY